MLKVMKEEHYSELLMSFSERSRLLVCDGSCILGVMVVENYFLAGLSDRVVWSI